MLPSCLCFYQIHPDRWALLLLSLLSFHVGDHIELSFPVSKEFAEAFQLCGKSIGPIDDSLGRPTTTTKHKRLRAGICFSTGPRSFTLSEIIPNSVQIHLDDWQGDSKSNEKAYYILDKSIQMGKNVYLLKTDAYNLFKDGKPPLSLSYAQGVLVMAEKLNLDSCHLGCCLRDSECVSTNNLRGCLFGKTFLYTTEWCLFEESLPFWNKLYNIVGLPISVPFCGMTDRSCLRSIDLSQSLLSDCMDGFKKDCGKCSGCFFLKSMDDFHFDTPANFKKWCKHAIPLIKRDKLYGKWNILWSLINICRKDIPEELHNYKKILHFDECRIKLEGIKHVPHPYKNIFKKWMEKKK